MKSPLGKLRGFRLHRSDAKDKRDLLPSAQVDELAQAGKDMQDMRNCYDSLLSAAAATANSAYEFSESLREMGSCLLEKTALHEDEESGNVLLMLGKVQFELQKLVDSYRSHIVLTITNPSESLLNEIRTVEDMKRQCDEKRNVYEYVAEQQKEKGKSKSVKGESFTLQQFRTAHDEYEEEATLCVFRVKSLKQGQSRSLLTQAARHHAAQLNFFRKGLKSLEEVDQRVKLVTEQQHIDYQFCTLEDESREEGDDVDDNIDSSDGIELSFDYRVDTQGRDLVSASRKSMEVDDMELSFTQVSTTEKAEKNMEKDPGNVHRPVSHSAPIFPERKSDPSERIRQVPSSTRKSSTHVLPTPTDAKNKTSSSVALTKPTDRARNLWHSSPLDQKQEKDSNTNNASTQLPLPSNLDPYNTSDHKKIKRQSFSGPITSKPWSTKSMSKVSPTGSPPLAPSPRVSELHELPRPPGSLSAKSALIGHSAPLVRNPVVTKFASPLPIPPLVVARSFSIPSSSQRAMAVHSPPN